MESVQPAMQHLHDKPGSDSESSPSGQRGSFADPAGRKVDLSGIISQANTIPISVIMQHYGHRVDAYNRRLRCPFHNGGNERTPSFWVYLDTNSFYCFGCKAAGRPVQFVALSESISKPDAALFIIEKWGQHINANCQSVEVYDEQFDNTILEFSDYIRSFVKNNKSSPEALGYIENLCFSFDKMMHKYNLNNDSLTALIDKIKERLEIYK